MEMNAKTAFVETEFTPNPESLKFNVSRVLLEKGSAYFPDQESAGGVPFIRKIFGVSGVKAVMIGQNFVTVTRMPETRTWAPIISPVAGILEAELAGDKPFVIPEGNLLAGTAPGGTDLEIKIKQVLDDKIRPAVARDGGDIVFHGFKNGVVTLHLQGACSSCPSSAATLKMGVERLLRELVPEVKEVVQV
jgi:Fe-S cluster biogenesis protein NfuA